MHHFSPVILPSSCSTILPVVKFATCVPQLPQRAFEDDHLSSGHSNTANSSWIAVSGASGRARLLARRLPRGQTNSKPTQDLLYPVVNLLSLVPCWSPRCRRLKSSSSALHSVLLSELTSSDARAMHDSGANSFASIKKQVYFLRPGAWPRGSRG
jgi:hypothetical protein